MYKVKALATFQDRKKRLISIGRIFDTDDKYAKRLIGYKLVEVISITKEQPKVIKEVKMKAKEVYTKKIIEPEKNKEEEKVEPKKELVDVPDEGFEIPKPKKKKRKYTKRSRW